MNTDSKGGSRPVPDPTVLTTEQLVRAIQSEREYSNGQFEILKERLRGIDKASEVLSNEFNRAPTEIQKEISHLKDFLMDRMDGHFLVDNERFHSIETQFKERDTRSERESRDNKTAVDAAFSAQKEAAAKQDEANAKAIDKSERATAETIKTNQELNQATTNALTKSLDEVKLQISKIEAIKLGATEHRTEQRLDSSQLIAIIGTFFVGLAVATAILVAILKK